VTVRPRESVIYMCIYIHRFICICFGSLKLGDEVAHLLKQKNTIRRRLRGRGGDGSNRCIYIHICIYMYIYIYIYIYVCVEA